MSKLGQTFQDWRQETTATLHLQDPKVGGKHCLDDLCVLQKYEQGHIMMQSCNSNS